MTLRYKGEVRIQADKAAVWDFMTDPRRIARCLPEAVDLVIEDGRHFRAMVPIDVGPMRGKVKLNSELIPDPAGDRLSIVITGGGLGSSVSLTAIADLAERDDGTTMLTWQGEAEARGTVSMVGRRVVDEQARKFIARGFACLRRNVAAVSISGGA